ncbi:MAG: penicillin-binding protein 1C [Pseudomonadota bacterium]
MALMTISAVVLHHQIKQDIGAVDLSASHDLSKVVLDRKDRLLRAYITTDGKWRLPADRASVDPRYVRMLLAYEDRRFHAHAGVDWISVGRAVVQVARYGRVVSGASTLTMQVARLLDRRHERTLMGKLRQMTRARQLEQRLSKGEILDIYLRLAPFGGNLEGIRAASLAYLGKEPKRLSIGEAALLVALPQSPESRRPDRGTRFARSARDRVLDRMVGAGVITTGEARAAKRERVPERRTAFPLFAGHLTDREVAARPDVRRHRLTIDRPLQARLEQLTAQHAKTRGPRLSAAVIVADHKTGDVHAHVGSPGFFSRTRFGAVDMAHAVRSPGSTLKPFVYGFAFESGVAHPEMMIEDRPVRFGHYTPENFDKEYRGTISIRAALQKSLNVPAVKVLHRIGPARFLARMRKGGPEPHLPGRAVPTLAIALGGLGYTLEDLATLYTALPNGGITTPLRTNRAVAHGDVTEDYQSREQRRMMSLGAAWAVSNILAGTPPPHNARRGRIAFKTGTSYGHRDAWAIGFDGRYVVAVWVGRPDGVATPALTGISAAAPLLFDTFQHVEAGRRTPLPARPPGVLVARASALPPPLRRFRFRARTERADHTPLQIVFPPQNASLDLPPTPDGANSHRARPIVLRAKGGVRPLTWLVDGKPIESPPHRDAANWQPVGPGFSQVTVIDAAGAADRVSVRLH